MSKPLEDYSQEARFVAYLADLQREAGKMAEIRRAAKSDNLAATPAAAHIAPKLRELKVPDTFWAEDPYYFVAGLFAQVHTQARRFSPRFDPEKDTPYYEQDPRSSTRSSLGRSFRDLKRATGSRDKENSTDKRFVRLLNCHEEDLPRQLRHAVRLLASGLDDEVRAHRLLHPVDWIRLLYDVRHFGHPNRFVQEHWARQFWKHDKGSDSA